MRLLQSKTNRVNDMIGAIIGKHEPLRDASSSMWTRLASPALWWLIQTPGSRPPFKGVLLAGALILNAPVQFAGA
jgi:hypothetical protein